MNLVEDASLVSCGCPSDPTGITGRTSTKEVRAVYQPQEPNSYCQSSGQPAVNAWRRKS